MKLTVHNAIDARQAPEWGEYLKKIGWDIERVDDTYIFIHKTPIINRSVIKIQHPIGPLSFNKIEKVAKKYNALFTLIEPHTQGYSEKSFLKNNYQKTYMRFAHTATTKIDLQKSEAELFATFSENAKRNIRKAQKNNLKVKEIWFKDDKDDFYFKKYYSLLTLLSKRKKFYSPSYAEYHKKMTAFKKTSVLLFAYADNETEPLAVVWYASYEGVMTYMQTGITQKGYDLLANYLLVWEGLKLAQRKNIKVFDFESIHDPRFPKENKGWKGYSEFKKRFHGEIVEYPPTWIKFYSRTFKWFYICTSFFPH